MGFNSAGCQASIAPSVATQPDGSVVLEIILKRGDPDNLKDDERATFVRENR